MSTSKDSVLVDSYNLASRSSNLRLTAKTIAEGLRSGTFQSLRKGQGIEFSGVRDYLIGDDIRTIDWNVTARMNKPYVKMFEEEREMVIFLIIDQSLSMETGSGKKTRLQTASEAGALITFAAEQNSSPIGAVFFDSSINFSYSPKSGREHAMVLVNKLDKIKKNRKPGSVLSNAIRGANNFLKKPSLVVIISDFRTSKYENELASLAVKHDVLAICITDPTDTDFPNIGSLNFYDTESNVVQLLPTSNENFRKSWKSYNQNRRDNFQKFCVHHGVSPIFLSTQDDPVFVLNRFFDSRTKR